MGTANRGRRESKTIQLWIFSIFFIENNDLQKRTVYNKHDQEENENQGRVRTSLESKSTGPEKLYQREPQEVLQT